MRTLAIILTAAAVPSATVAQTPQSGPVIEYHADPESTLPFSPAVRVGDLIFLSGQIGQDEAGKLPAGMDAQARLAMDNVAKAAKRAGVGMDRLVKCTAMLKDMRQWNAFNAVYRTYFTPGRLPARSAFGATGLAYGALVEVECIAAAPARPQR